MRIQFNTFTVTLLSAWKRNGSTYGRWLYADGSTGKGPIPSRCYTLWCQGETFVDGRITISEQEGS